MLSPGVRERVSVGAREDRASLYHRGCGGFACLFLGGWGVSKTKTQKRRPKTPWTKTKTPWPKTKTPWTKTKTPWTKTKTPGLKRSPMWILNSCERQLPLR